MALSPRSDRPFSNQDNEKFITPLLDDSWEGDRGSPITLTYKINSSSVAYNNAIKNALQEFSNVGQITFIETSASSVDFTFGLSSIDSNTLGITYFNSIFPIGDISIDLSSDFFTDADFAINEAGYETIIHEIGHGLGLAHPDGNGLWGTPLSASFNTLDFTLMVPFSDDLGPVTTALGSPSTLQFADMATIQWMYGANNNYKSGNDVYTFNSKSVSTLWDAGGIDEINAFSSQSSVTINLNDGSSGENSRIGDAAFWIGPNVVIENVIGGQSSDEITGNEAANILKGFNGNDVIHGNDGDDFINGNKDNDVVYGDFGNDTVRGGKQLDTVFGGSGDDFVAGDRSDDQVFGGLGHDYIRGGKDNDNVFGESGNDTIYGDKGNDSIYGGTGNDIFVFKEESGSDIIFDFVSGEDAIQIDLASINSFADVLANFSNQTIDFGNGNIVKINDLNSISEADVLII